MRPLEPLTAEKAVQIKVSVSDVSKVFSTDGKQVSVLENVSLERENLRFKRLMGLKSP